MIFIHYSRFAPFFRQTGGPSRAEVQGICAAVFLLFLFLFTNRAHCAQIAWWQYPQREQVEIVFSQDIPVPDVRRIDPTTVRILASRTAWGPPEELALPAFTGADLLQALVPEGDGLLIRLQSKAFGFVSQYDASARQLTVDFVPDPLGGRWLFEPSAPAPRRPDDPPFAAGVGETVHQPAKEQIKPIPASESRPAREIVQVPREETVREETAGEVASRDAAEADVQSMVRAPLQTPSLQPAPPVPSPQFPPSGALRSRIQRVGPDEAQPISLPAAVADQSDQARPEAPVVEEQAPAMPAQPVQAQTDPAPAPRESGTTMQRREITRAQPQAEKSVPEAQPEEQSEAGTEAVAEKQPEAVVEKQDGGAAEIDVKAQEAAQVADAESQPGELSTDIEQRAADPEESYRKRLATARAAVMNGEYEGAVLSLRALASMRDLSPALREDVLYDLADALFSLHMDDLAENFAEVAEAYEQAMNINPKSPRAALSLRNLGLVHLKANNLPEAMAYFNVLRQEFPRDPLVPSADYYLGDYFLERGDYARAADHFQKVVEKYPEHSIARQSAVGLARSLYALGFDDRAFQIMDYLEKRWPRYYVDDPSLLELAGIIALRANSLESAKQRLLTYYNLVPDSQDAHMLLARLGDVYLLTGKPDAAKHVFEKAARAYPNEEGGLIAQMRLVEGGIHDDPSLEDMFINLRAAQVYTHIIEKHPESPLAAVAKVKLAIWQVWNKRLEDSLATVRDFLDNRPHHTLAPKVQEVGVEAFSQLVDRNLQDVRYEEIIEQWNANPYLHPLEQDFSDQAKLGLAMAYWKTGDHARAIQIARPRLQDLAPEQTKGLALDLVLGIYLESQQWEQIVQLETLRQELALAPDRLRELDYALALALENLGRGDEARPYWLELADDIHLAEAQRGFALYYLARAAMQGEDLEKVYLYTQEALSLLLLERKDSAKIRDCISWLTQVTERTGRLQEALAWALEFDQLIAESDPDWAMSRYRLAQLYQRVHDHEQWHRVLEDLQQKDPRGLYGRLAGSALQGRELEDSAVRFRQ